MILMSHIPFSKASTCPSEAGAEFFRLTSLSAATFSLPCVPAGAGCQRKGAGEPAIKTQPHCFFAERWGAFYEPAWASFSSLSIHLSAWLWGFEAVCV